MRIAKRISRLGTETAFAVSAEAAEFAARGNKVYPFHLGDLNFTTPNTVMQAAVKAMKDGKTGYCPNAGIPLLRETLAADISASRGIPYGMENVAIQPGGKPTIGKVIQTLMDPGDEVLYPNPGYPIYESQIEFHGGRAIAYGYYEGDRNFVIDLDSLEKKITSRTKLLILNDLRNPTGAECSAAELESIAALARQHDLAVLCDEAYFDIRYEGKSASFASLQVPGIADENARFTDLENGTVGDNTTGLIWLKSANCFRWKSFEKATALIDELQDGQCGLSDGSAAGDRRPPSVWEWEDFFVKKYREPALSNAAVTGKWKPGDPFDNVQNDYYWTGSAYPDPTGRFNNAYCVHLYYGVQHNKEQALGLFVWPVRDPL